MELKWKIFHFQLPLFLTLLFPAEAALGLGATRFRTFQKMKRVWYYNTSTTVKMIPKLFVITLPYSLVGLRYDPWWAQWEDGAYIILLIMQIALISFFFIIRLIIHCACTFQSNCYSISREFFLFSGSYEKSAYSFSHLRIGSQVL